MPSDDDEGLFYLVLGPIRIFYSLPGDQSSLSPKCTSKLNDCMAAATDVSELSWLNLDIEDGEEKSSLEVMGDDGSMS